VREFVRRLDPKHARIATDRARLDALQQRRQTAAARFFRDNAQRWDELRALHVADREIERALAHHLPLGARRLLDIGTGTGRLLEVLAPKVEQAIGIDQSREMLALARANLARAGIDNADIRQGDMYALPFEADSFDVVTIHHVLHYADDPSAALSEAARVVKPGGTVLVVDFSPHDLVELKREHAHVHLGFADNQVQGWLKTAGLTPLEPIHFPGRRLMTGIWRGERVVPQRAPARAVAIQGFRDVRRLGVSRALAAAPAGLVRILAAPDRGAERTLWETVTRLTPLRPAFFSVTYGAAARRASARTRRWHG